MLNNLFSKYMIDQVLKYKVPMVQPKNCIDSLQNRKKCGKCIELCEAKAISFHKEIKIDKELCNNCNVCTSVCPCGCISPNYELVEKQYNSFYQNHNISIGCNEDDILTDLKIQCLAAIPWEALAYVAITDKVRLNLNPCEGCKRTELALEVRHILDKLKLFLGDEKYEEKVVFIEGNEQVQPREYSRRDLLKLWGHQSKRMANFVIPIEIDKEKNGRVYKSMLIKRVEELEEEYNEDFGWQIIEVNHNCWACGVCSKVCPQKAININRNKDGSGVFEHDYTRCTHCGICKVVCNESAIELVTKRQSFKNKVNKYKVIALTCSVCNDPIKNHDSNKCVVCRKKK